MTLIDRRRALVKVISSIELSKFQSIQLVIIKFQRSDKKIAIKEALFHQKHTGIKINGTKILLSISALCSNI